MLVYLPTDEWPSIISLVKARELIRRRIAIAENGFADIVVWHVPKRVPGSTHTFKYHLAYVVDDHCVLRYDNESGKGDHRHIDDREERYEFSNPRQLMTDFFSEITRWNYEHGHD